MIQVKVRPHLGLASRLYVSVSVIIKIELERYSLCLSMSILQRLCLGVKALIFLLIVIVTYNYNILNIYMYIVPLNFMNHNSNSSVISIASEISIFCSTINSAAVHSLSVPYILLVCLVLQSSAPRPYTMYI